MPPQKHLLCIVCGYRIAYPDGLCRFCFQGPRLMQEDEDATELEPVQTGAEKRDKKEDQHR
jgi:hypothetical protein